MRSIDRENGCVKGTDRRWKIVRTGGMSLNEWFTGGKMVYPITDSGFIMNSLVFHGATLSVDEFFLPKFQRTQRSMASMVPGTTVLRGKQSCLWKIGYHESTSTPRAYPNRAAELRCMKRFYPFSVTNKVSKMAK